MDDVRLQRAQDVRNPIGDERRTVGFVEGRAHPVVDDLDDRHPVVHAPGHGSMPPGRVEIRAQHGHVVRRALRAAQLERVDFRSCLMPGKEIVNRVEDPHELSRRAAG